MKPVYLLKPTPADSQQPHLKGLPYGVRVRIRGRNNTLNLALIETLQGRLVGRVSLNSLERA